MTGEGRSTETGADKRKQTGGMSDAKRRLGLYSFLSPSLHRYARHSSRPSVVSVPFLSAFGLESGSLHALRADCKERRGTRVTRAGRERMMSPIGRSSCWTFPAFPFTIPVPSTSATLRFRDGYGRNGGPTEPDRRSGIKDRSYPRHLLRHSPLLSLSHRHYRSGSIVRRGGTESDKVRKGRNEPRVLQSLLRSYRLLPSSLSLVPFGSSFTSFSRSLRSLITAEGRRPKDGVSDRRWARRERGSCVSDSRLLRSSCRSLGSFPHPTPLAPQAGREPRSALPSGSRLRPVCDARIGGIGEVNGESKMKVERSEDMRRLTEAMR